MRLPAHLLLILLCRLPLCFGVGLPIKLSDKVSAARESTSSRASHLMLIFVLSLMEGGSASFLSIKLISLNNRRLV